MYRCKGHIGCLTGTVTRVGDDLKGFVARACGELSGSVSRIGKGLEGSVTFVCTTNRDAYLRVTPDVIWLTPDMISGEFDIYSNVAWRID